MRHLICLLAIISIITRNANGAWYDIFSKAFEWYYMGVHSKNDRFQDKLIERRYCERYIKKKLPPDFPPSENPSCRTPET